MGKPQPHAGASDTPVTLRFFSVRECIMAKRYFDLRSGFEGKAFFVRDFADRDLSRLHWDRFPKVGEDDKPKGQRPWRNAGQNSSNYE
jgi:hypothetical protein